MMRCFLVIDVSTGGGRSYRTAVAGGKEEHHGIKMTGMPSFGKTHSSEQLTNITAFIEKMPTMTAEEYQQLTGQGQTTTR